MLLTLVAIDTRREMDTRRVAALGPVPAHGASAFGTALNLIEEQPLYINVQWFRGGLVFEAHRLLYHSA